VGDIYGVIPFRSTHGGYDLGQHFRNDQAAEGLGAKGFIQKEACLNSAEAEANVRACPGQRHDSAPVATQVSVFILGGPGWDDHNLIRASVRVDNRLPINFLSLYHLQKLDCVV
jgi:hypothetical protein